MAYIDRWLNIDGILVSSWIARRRRNGKPVPVKVHNAAKKYRLMDIVAIARGSGAVLSIPEYFGLKADLCQTRTELITLKAELAKLNGVKKAIFEQPDHFERLSPYIYSEHDIISKSKPLATTSGIYFLIKDGKVVYVGQSVNFLSRVASHELSKDFDRLAFLPCTADMFPHIESFYIHMLRPKLNATHKSGRMIAPVSRESMTFVSCFEKLQALACP